MKRTLLTLLMAGLLMGVSLPAQAVSYDFYVGEVGKPINYYPNPTPPPAFPVNFTGMTVVMNFKRPDGTTVPRTMTPSMDGTYARYTLTGSDLTMDGAYTFQWFALFDGSTCQTAAICLKSKKKIIQVGASL